MKEQRHDGVLVDHGICPKCDDEGYTVDGRPATLDELMEWGIVEGNRVTFCDCLAGESAKDAAADDAAMEDLGGEA